MTRDYYDDDDDDKKKVGKKKKKKMIMIKVRSGKKQKEIIVARINQGTAVCQRERWWEMKMKNRDSLMRRKKICK